jgi:uncharacterized lipoprotein YbaY
MKKRSPFAAVAAIALLCAGGCGHLDLTPEGDPNRVLTGSVDFDAATTLPDDSIVVVRVVDPTGLTETAPAQVLGSPTAAESKAALPPKVLGEQVIHGPVQAPIPFRLEYKAGDEQLRRGLNIEVRISSGGRVRYFNVNSVAITLNNVNDPHAVVVNRVN